MQRPINENIYLGQTVDPNNHTGEVKSIDISSNFNEITRKVDKLGTLLKKEFLIKMC